MSICQELYDSEINFKVSSFWDGGFDVWIGDDLNGFRSQDCLRTWAEVEEWLKAEAIVHWPESVFAKMHRT